MPFHNDRKGHEFDAGMRTATPSFAIDANATLSFQLIEESPLSARSVAYALLLALALYIPISLVIGYGLKHPSLYADFYLKQPDDSGAHVVRPEVVFSFSPAAFQPGETVTLTATVVGAAGTPMPTGKVRFLMGYETLKFSALQNGSTSIKTKIPRIHSQDALRALYLGDDYYSSAYSDPLARSH
jgi:Bacterial Ig-like domain (group 3)